MRRSLMILLGLAPLILAGSGPKEPDSEPPHRITQVSVIDALMVGRYDGVMSIGELLRHGDFGVGTLDHLDGELIILDGRAYQVRGDGQILDVGTDRSTPFVTVTRFAPTSPMACPPVASLTALEDHLNTALPQRNNFAAIRIDGRFRTLTLRSVHRQEPPYRPLDVVAKTQSMWTRHDQEGTLVGIRCPAWAGGINVPGYHWHFLSRDRRVGGHVLDCRVEQAEVRSQICRDWEVKLEGSAAFNKADLVKDRSRELHQVESSRGEPAAPTPPRN